MTRIKTLIVFCLICVHPCLSVAQIDYSKFSHATPKHKATCNTCHKISFPDINDYPSHNACVSCHRPQFFRGAKPPICSVCHSKTSPRDEARLAFRNPASKLQFAIEFPHDKHQDVIAMLRFSHAPQNYYNCTICHGQRTATFKAVPADHSSCFNCHWKSQQPVADNCNGCHKLSTTPFTPADKPTRISAKFIHEGGDNGVEKKHVKECTACHINITKSTPPGQKPKPDVPITACTECHNKDGLGQDLNKEIAALQKNRSFTCSYCHAPNVGNLEVPASHFLISGYPPFKRKDIR
jgi:hypothetical protein